MRVVVVGGGPAGAATAISLRRAGISVDVFEATRTAQARTKIGEYLPPSTAPLLNLLGIGQRLSRVPSLRPHGARSYWGSTQAVERDFIFDRYGPGWQVDRTAFEALLAEVAVECGVRWHYGSRVGSIQRRGDAWLLGVDQAGARQTHECEFVVDASGRSATVARRLGAARRTEPLVGVGVYFRPTGSSVLQETCTVVESVRDGWWYSALLADGRLVVMYFTDRDTPDFADVRRARGWCDLLSQAPQTCARLRAHHPARGAPLKVLVAGSARTHPCGGAGWLAVGDAAAAYDPLSAYGITAALSFGVQAAQAVAGGLQDEPEAMVRYGDLVAKVCNAYEHACRQVYAAERRWSDRPFWRRHASAPSPGADISP